MNVDFGNIIQNSFSVAWRHKTLWIFGLFAGGVEGFNTDWMDKVDYDRMEPNFMYDLFDRMDIPYEFLSPQLALIGALILWILAIALLFFICYLIAQPAIIDGINKITRGGQYRFGTSFSRGADFFWRFFGISLVEIFVALVTIFTVVILAVVLTPFTLLLTIPLGIAIVFFTYHTFGLAEVAMVARDIQIADAIAEGWSLVQRNLGNCFIMTLVLIGMGIGFAIVIFMAALIFYLPINLLVYGMTGNIVGILLLALFIGLPVAMLLGGYTGTFFNAMYVQFYFRLVEPVPATAQVAPAQPQGPATI
jgi:hypothetical protein